MSFIKKNIPSLLILSLLLISCGTDDKTDDSIAVESVQLNVPYGEHPQQVYDLYLPEDRSSESTPVVALIHGGGWTAGDKDDITNVVALLQAQHPELAIVNINYILATSDTPAFPNQFYDIQAVMSQLTEQSGELQIRPIFGLVGMSAGAHLAMMVDSRFDPDDQVAFVVNIVGPTDLTDPFYSENIEFYDYLLQLLVDDSAYPETADIPEAISPAFNISTSTSPTLLFYGQNDDIVPISNAHTYRQVLEDSNVPHSLTVFDGGHGNDWTPQDWTLVFNQISNYIGLYLNI